MHDAIQLLSALRHDRRGVTAMEYAVIAASVVVVAGIALAALGGRMSNVIGGIVSGY